MIVNITTTNVQVIPELNAVNLTITPILSSGAGGGGGDVTKAYVDAHINNVLNPHQTSFENIQGYPAIPTGKVLFDDKTFKEVALPTRHDLLRDKNGNLAYQHIDTSIEKTNPIDDDSVGIWDSVAGRFVLTTIMHLKAFLKNYFDIFYLRTSYTFACSDETTDITASTTTPKILYRFAEPFVMDGIIGGLDSAAVTGLFTIIVKKNGVSIFSTNLTFDSGEVTTTTASTPYAFTSSTISFAIDDYVEIFVTNVGAVSAGKGLKITLLGHK